MLRFVALDRRTTTTMSGLPELPPLPAAGGGGDASATKKKKKKNKVSGRVGG